MSHAAACRSCGETSLSSIVKWERPTAVKASGAANALPPEMPPGELVFCPACSLVQRVEHGDRVAGVPREQLLSAPAAVGARSARQLASQIIATHKLRPTSLVVQIGSRDGRMLAEYQAADIPVLGIEPAMRLAELARIEHGVPTLCQHFDKRLATELVSVGQAADVVVVHHALTLAAAPNEVCGGVHTLLKSTGVALFEVPSVKHLLDHGAPLSPHHPERMHFSLTSLHSLLSRSGLVVLDVEVVAETGSLRLYVGKQGTPAPRVATLLAEEKAWGVDRLATYLPQRAAKVA